MSSQCSKEITNWNFVILNFLVNRFSDQFQVVLCEAFEALEDLLCVIRVLAWVGACFDRIVMTLSNLSSDIVKMEAMLIIVEVHVLEDAVQVGGWGVIFEFPLFVMGDCVVGKVQWFLALISVGVQVSSGANMVVGVGLYRDWSKNQKFYYICWVKSSKKKTYAGNQCENDEGSHVWRMWCFYVNSSQTSDAV